MARFYYFTISQKEVPRKFCLDPRFPRNPKLKQILKWLPLDRGCFKIYFFTKGESFFYLIIPCHTYCFFTRKSVILFQVIIVLPCILFWLNCFVICHYQSEIFRKEVTWKLWLDPRFPQNPKLKWILKWLPLDRGYFKVYFFKREKFSNNLVPYISLNS